MPSGFTPVVADLRPSMKGKRSLWVNPGAFRSLVLRIVRLIFRCDFATVATVKCLANTLIRTAGEKANRTIGPTNLRSARVVTTWTKVSGKVRYDIRNNAVWRLVSVCQGID